MINDTLISNVFSLNIKIRLRTIIHIFNFTVNSIWIIIFNVLIKLKKLN